MAALYQIGQVRSISALRLPKIHRKPPREMNRAGPRAKKMRAPRQRSAPRKLKWRQILRVVQRPFGWVFWLLDQRIGELDVEIESRRT